MIIKSSNVNGIIARRNLSAVAAFSALLLTFGYLCLIDHINIKDNDNYLQYFTGDSAAFLFEKILNGDGEIWSYFAILLAEEIGWQFIVSIFSIRFGNNYGNCCKKNQN